MSGSRINFQAPATESEAAQGGYAYVPSAPLTPTALGRINTRLKAAGEGLLTQRMIDVFIAEVGKP